METTKKISWEKDEGAFDYSSQIVEEFLLELHEAQQSRSCRPKSVDSKTLFLAIEVYKASSIQRVSGKLSICQFRVVHHLHKFGKSIWSCQIVLCYQNIAKLLTYPSVSFSLWKWFIKHFLECQYLFFFFRNILYTKIKVINQEMHQDRFKEII